MAPSVEVFDFFAEVGFDEHGVPLRVEVLLPPDDVGAVGVGDAPVEVRLLPAHGTHVTLRAREGPLPRQRGRLLLRIQVREVCLE